jgi:uncharacterized protein
MKFLKSALLAFILIIPQLGHALESEAQVEYSDALRSGKVAVVKKYLDQGLDVNEVFFAWSSLQIATNHNQLEVVKFLIDKGANVDYVHPVTQMTALHLAAFDGHYEIAKYLISKGADVNLPMKGGVSILHAIHLKGDKKMEDLLVSAGAKDDGCVKNCFY